LLPGGVDCVIKNQKMDSYLNRQKTSWKYKATKEGIVNKQIRKSIVVVIGICYLSLFAACRPQVSQAPPPKEKQCPDFLNPDKVITRGHFATFSKIGPMTLHGKKYGRYVLQHPANEGATEVLYNLEGKASRFTATIGLDQSMNPNDPMGDEPDVEYLIYTNGKLKWRSGIVTRKTPPKNVNIDLKGINELRLVVTNGGDQCYHDWAIWADPKIHSECKQ
jgi:hypothetical protein